VPASFELPKGDGGQRKGGIAQFQCSNLPAALFCSDDPPVDVSSATPRSQSV